MTLSIDQTIDGIERLYYSVTGKTAPPWSGQQHARIPPETDASEHLDQQLGRLLDAVHRLLAVDTASTVAHWSPLVSIRRDGRDHVVDVELAGVERETIEVQIAGNVLTVAGWRDLPDPRTSPSVLYSERAFGRFERRIPLPEHTAVGDLRAELRNGVLSVWIAAASHISADPQTLSID